MFISRSLTKITRICLFIMKPKFETTVAAALPAFPFKRPFGAEPPREFAILRKILPISKVGIVDNTAWAWLLTKHNDICQVLDDNEHFSKCRTLPNFPELTKGGRLAAAHKPTFVEMDPPEHTTSRGMVGPGFTIDSVKKMAPLIQHVADDSLNKMLSSPNSSADLVASFALPMASQIMYLILGIPLADMPQLSTYNAIRTNGSSTATQASIANKELLDYLTSLVEKKANAQQHERDLITTLVTEQLKPGKIQLDDLVQVVFLMLVAGNATMVSMIALGVVTFLQHPLQLAAVRANPTLMNNAVKELCRFHTASALASRRIAIRDVVVAGTLIRAGEGVIASTQSGNRDESVFANPDSFDIHRVFSSSAKSLAYGHGQHQCVAEYLALSELEIALNTLFAKLPNLQLAMNQEDVKYSPPEADVGILELPVSW